MQTISWLGFCISNALTKTSVHFCPSARNIAAPYPINCKLTLFGSGLSEAAAVVLEGARLRQPDGVRISDIFSPLRDGLTGLFGLGIELLSPQSRLDLSPSQCLVEICSAHFSCRFKPSPMQTNEQSQPDCHQFLGLEDNFSNTGMIVVNGSDLDFIPSFEPVGTETTADNSTGQVINALSAQEIPVRINGSIDKFQTWCDASVSAFRTKTDLPQEMAGYIIYRDTQTKEPVSVCAL